MAPHQAQAVASMPKDPPAILALLLPVKLSIPRARNESAVKTKVDTTAAVVRKEPRMKSIVTLSCHQLQRLRRGESCTAHHPSNEIEPDGLTEFRSQGSVRILVGGDDPKG